MKKLPLFFVIISILVFFVKLFFPTISVFTTPDFGQSDLLHGYYPLKYIFWDALKNGRIPLWIDQIATGYPVFADGQGGILFFANFLLFLIFPFFWALNLSYVVTFLFAAIGTYLLARLYKLSPWLSAYVSIVFSLSGFTIAQITHLSLLQAASFLPWYLYFIEKLDRKVTLTSMLLFAILVSQQVFVGHQQMTVYTIFAGFLYMTGKPIIDVSAKKIRTAKIFINIVCFSTVIGIASLLSLIVLLPSYELLKLSTRSVMELQVSWYPFPVKHLLTFLDPFLFGNPKYGTYPIISEHWGIFWENTGYVGIIPLILLGLSLFLLKKPSLFLFGLLLFSLLFILGKYSPLYFIHEFPPFSLFRVPSRFLFFVDLLIALLAGYTLRAIFIKSKRILQYEGFVVILLILIHTINIFYYFYNYHPVGKVDEWYQTPKVIEYLKRDKSRFRIFTIDNTSQWNEIFLKEGWRHPEKYLQFREAMIGHENFFYGIPKSNFYTSFVTKRMKAVNDLLFGDIKKEKNDIRIGTNAASLLGIMNVKYILSPLPVRDFEKVFESNGISLYKNAHFQNRVIFARQYKKIDTLNDVKNTLISREFDPENVVLLEKDVQGDFIACDDPKSSCQVNLNIQIDIPGHLVVNVNSDRDGIVVFSDSYYPGWEARVDNRPVAILAANINQKAVVVKRGKHIVSFIYQPQTVRLGATVSAIGYLVVLIALLFLIRKRH